MVGKLLKYVGEDNVLWGTDCIWYGSPQDQLQAFRAFEISEELQERYGYPKLTPELKAKILGLNGAAIYKVDPKIVRREFEGDRMGKAKSLYQNDPDPSFMTYGPKSRREVLNLIRMNRGRPA